MNKLPESPSLPLNPDTAYARALTRYLTEIFRNICSNINQLSDGRQGANTFSLTSAPTTGTFAKGDFVTNSNPVELGAVGAKYVIRGWIKLDSGFVESRTLTGN
jgi:hypothetical protein